MLHVLHAMLHGRGSKIPEIYALGQQLLEQVREIAPGVLTGFEERKPKKADTLDLSSLIDNLMLAVKTVEKLGGKKEEKQTEKTHKR